MLARCSTSTQVSVSVASTKVALTLQGLSLAKSRGKDLQDCIMLGSVLVLCNGGTTSQDMGDTLGALLHSLRITSPGLAVFLF